MGRISDIYLAGTRAVVGMRERDAAMMSEELIAQMDKMIRELSEAGRVIVYDMLWKATRKDWHGVCDCSNDMREQHL